MHMFSREQNFFGGHGIVASQVSIGTGLGFAHRYKKNNAVSFVYFGDGAVNQGQVYESFNMASLWKLPVVYIIENNKYGMGTSVERASATTDLYHRGRDFGIVGEQVNGMDVREVFAAGLKAATHARKGEGPVVLEMKTYRYRGHSMSDPQKYRTREEISQVRKESDPIDHLRDLLIEQKMASEDELKEFDREVKAQITEAAEFAQQNPEPDPSELFTDVLADA
jgi:pyruvate dehydrogenase E1 component alpha subunit